MTNKSFVLLSMICVSTWIKQFFNKSKSLRMSLIYIGKDDVEEGKTILSRLKSASKLIQDQEVKEIAFNGGTFNDAELAAVYKLVEETQPAVQMLSLVFLDPPLSNGRFDSLLHIRSLDLGNSQFPASGGDQLSKLMTAGALEELWLANANVNNRALDSIVVGLKNEACTLKCLSLEGNPLNDASLRRLFDVLKSTNRTLTTLYVQNSLSCTTSVPVLADAISNGGVLQTISVSVSGLKPLKQVAATVPSLQRVSIQVDKKTKLNAAFIKEQTGNVVSSETLQFFELKTAGSDDVPIYYIKPYM